MSGMSMYTGLSLSTNASMLFSNARVNLRGLMLHESESNVQHIRSVGQPAYELRSSLSEDAIALVFHSLIATPSGCRSGKDLLVDGIV